MFELKNYQDSADFIKEKIGDFKPQVLMILGSGLSYLADLVLDPIIIPYSEIPNFKKSTAPGHIGRLVFGTLSNKNVMIMQGRMHHYEGYSFSEITFPVRVAKLLGAKEMIVTNACGGINSSFNVGEIMLITDHIKIFGESPLRGENIPEFGERFPDMSYTYTKALREIARNASKELDIVLREGTYMYFFGPQYETPAEIRMAGILGADAVGMSTVPEAICASQAKMKVLGFSLVTNMAAGILDKPLTEKEVLDAAEEARPHFSALILKCLEKM